jgi:ubiquinone/menaquinone biosynthesis C-methylase UbiE
VQRTTCSACDCDDLRLFLDLGDSPLADAYTSTADEISKTYPLQLAVCIQCKLVQLLEVVDATTLFSSGYSFYSSSSPPLSAYHQEYAEKVLRDNAGLRNGFILEVGCNDGDLLRWFNKTLQFDVLLGVDMAEGPIAKARERGVSAMHNEFTHGLAQVIREEYGPANVVIANHTLAHVTDVNDMLAGVAAVLADDGVAYIEVQYLPDLLVNNSFDMVYHEHRNFFSFTSLQYVAKKNHLDVVDVQLTHRQQGSMRVKLKHWAAATHVSKSVVDVLDSEYWLRAGTAYTGFQGRVERIRTRLWDLLWENVQAGASIAGYGAPAKATTLLNYCDIDSNVLDYVVDNTPEKQGRFIPGTGIPIVSPTTWIEREAPDVYLLTAWNYARWIIANNSPEYGGRWILPLPAPMML